MTARMASCVVTNESRYIFDPLFISDDGLKEHCLNIESPSLRILKNIVLIFINNINIEAWVAIDVISTILTSRF